MLGLVPWVGQVHAAPSLAVIYPEVAAPESDVFHDIILGIDKQQIQTVFKHEISNQESPEDSINWIEQQQPDLLIALGKKGYRIAKRLYRERPVVIGALPIRPNGISGISLSAAPHILFSALKDLAPTIRKVNVVHSPESQWLIELAAQEAKNASFQFNAIAVSDLKGAVSSYEQLLKNLDPQNEALWLPDDNITAHEQVILPQLLESSWEQNLVLFSSTTAHAKRGALFSVLPDYEALGAELVTMITEMYQTEQPAGVIPLANAKLVVNLRTAAHLGFSYTRPQLQEFHLTFPQKMP